MGGIIMKERIKNKKWIRIFVGILVLNIIAGCTAGTQTNTGTLVVGAGEIGMTTSSMTKYISNHGTIEINSNGIGMLATGGRGIATNTGIININAAGSTGMRAVNGGSVINGESGIININGRNSYAMVAHGSGSSAINRGIINLNNSSLRRENAISSTNRGRTINDGLIRDYYGVRIYSLYGGAYVVGTNIDGTYGTVVSSAEIVIDGNMEISTEIVQRNYEDTYYLKNIMESPKIELMENFKISSTSLLL